MRQIIVAGNWKMNASKETVNTLVLGVLEGMPDIKSEVIVCVPYHNVFESLNANTLNHSVNLSCHHGFCVAGFSFF
jgi:triosephosphate isomerase